MGKSERENELAAFEARLGAFQPGASRIDRDQVMYRAGQAAALKQQEQAGSHHWRWPSAFAAMTTVAAALLLALVIEHQQAGSSPTTPAGRLAQDTGTTPSAKQIVQKTPAPIGTPRPPFPTADEVHWPAEPDLDALLAQLPAGRGLSHKPPWKDVGPARTSKPTDMAAPSRPVTYVKHRRMLLEELMPAKRELPMRTES